MPSNGASINTVGKNYKDNKNVVFISISISPDIDDIGGWREGIGKYNVPGSIQLNASVGTHSYTEGFNHPIISKYGISAYPQLVLIDKNGLLVTNTAPRPDSDGGKALTKLIDETLNQ